MIEESRCPNCGRTTDAILRYGHRTPCTRGIFIDFPIVTRPQGEIDREIMKARRIEIIDGHVFGQGKDGTIYVAEQLKDKP